MNDQKLAQAYRNMRRQFPTRRSRKNARRLIKWANEVNRRAKRTIFIKDDARMTVSPL
jgi:hypothetical protein